MKTYIYLANEDGTNKASHKELAMVELEVVPGGTYVIDGVAYTLVGRPTFHILTQIRNINGPVSKLTSVELLVRKLP
jgi:hypothetical protein